jgi:tetratricopeptide (TPR) repeat protein
VNEARTRLEEQLDHAQRDLSELREQVEAGELDAATADRLRGVYEAEAEAAHTGLEALGVNPQEPETAEVSESAPPSGIERADHEAQRDQALRDLMDVERRLEAGELDEDAAGRLRAEHAANAARAAAALDAGDTLPAPAPDVAGPGRAGSRFGRSRNRVLVGSAIILVGLSAAIFAVTRSTEPRQGAASPTTLATGDAPVTNDDLEAVVAANPEVAGMRAALAMRYFEERNLEKALEHQLIVAELEPTVDNYTVLGLFAFESGDNTGAAAYLEFALGMDPDYAPALWYLANTFLYGLEEPDQAIPVLQQLLASPDVPDDILHAVEEMITIAHEGTGTP